MGYNSVTHSSQTLVHASGLHDFQHVDLMPAPKESEYYNPYTGKVIPLTVADNAQVAAVALECPEWIIEAPTEVEVPSCA